VLTLDRAPGLRQDGAPQAALIWHVSDAVVDGRVVGIRGRTDLLTQGDGWRLGETRLLEVWQKEPAVTQRPALAQEPQLPLPAGAERRHVATARPSIFHQRRGPDERPAG
jgi:hypothetical protein